MAHSAISSQASTCDKNYRKLIAARFTIAFSFFISIFFTIYNYYDHNQSLFYLDFGLLIILLLTTLLSRKKGIFFLAHLFLPLMILALMVLIYLSKGQDGVMYWGYISIFLFMTFYGHKAGAIYSTLVFSVFFIMSFFWIGDTFSYQAYVRFVAASVILISIAFFYEYSIYKVITRLDDANLSLQKLSRIDGLTNLYNRRYFDEMFSNFLSISKREKSMVAFCIIDIDHFKDYNDYYGHQAGDEVLKRIAQAFKQEMQRPNDYIFRLGGEEFGILFNAPNEQKALKKVEKILNKIKALKLEHKASKVATYITVSAGLYIEEFKQNTSADKIYKYSDDALYQAKGSGRDKVCLYKPED